MVSNSEQREKRKRNALLSTKEATTEQDYEVSQLLKRIKFLESQLPADSQNRSSINMGNQNSFHPTGSLETKHNTKSNIVASSTLVNSPLPNGMSGLCPFCNKEFQNLLSHLVKKQRHFPLDVTPSTCRTVLDLGLELCRCGRICKSVWGHYYSTRRLGISPCTAYPAVEQPHRKGRQGPPRWMKTLFRNPKEGGSISRQEGHRYGTIASEATWGNTKEY